MCICTIIYFVRMVSVCDADRKSEKYIKSVRAHTHIHHSYNNADELLNQANPIGNVGQRTNTMAIDLILCGDIRDSSVRMSPFLLALNHTVVIRRLLLTSIRHCVKLSHSLTHTRTMTMVCLTTCVHVLHLFSFIREKKEKYYSHSILNIHAQID